MSTAGIGRGEQQYWTFQKYFILVTKLAKVLITQKKNPKKPWSLGEPRTVGIRIFRIRQLSVKGMEGGN